MGGNQDYDFELGSHDVCFLLMLADISITLQTATQVRSCTQIRMS